MSLRLINSWVRLEINVTLVVSANPSQVRQLSQVLGISIPVPGKGEDIYTICYSLLPTIPSTRFWFSRRNLGRSNRKPAPTWFK